MSHFTHFCGNILAKKICCAEIYRLLGLWPLVFFSLFTRLKAPSVLMVSLSNSQLQYQRGLTLGLSKLDIPKLTPRQRPRGGV